MTPLEIVAHVRAWYPEDVFPAPGPGSTPDAHAAAGTRLACDNIARLLREAAAPSGDPPCTGIAASWCPRCGECACPQNECGDRLAPDSKHAEADWLVLCLDEPGHGDVGLWWGPNRSGYTRRLDEAGRYTESEARRCAGAADGGDLAVPLSALEGRAVRVVPLDDIEGAWAGIRARRSRG